MNQPYSQKQEYWDTILLNDRGLFNNCSICILYMKSSRMCCQSNRPFFLYIALSKDTTLRKAKVK